MTNHQEQNAAIRDQFGKQASSYARLAGQVQSGRPAPIIDALKLTSADAVLDVACGPGRLSLSLARVAGQVTGIDITPEMLDQARALQAEQGITNVHWQQGDILPLPFDDGAFCIVVTQASFHHFADPAAVLAEMIRVCQPGGRIAVNDMTFDPPQAAAFDRIEKLRDPSHVRVLTLAQLRGLGEAAGLEELTVQEFPLSLPIEAVLATSFPAPGDLERVRALYREDAASGQDRLGMKLRGENGQLVASYPMTLVVWRRSV
jgi:ubiquinone/menaquinone biosynthesis C-methylase UbiE